jgi:hypothetical protein
MHDIKYFFLNENNQTIQESKLSKSLPKNIIFQNPGGTHIHAPVYEQHKFSNTTIAYV